MQCRSAFWCGKPVEQTGSLLLVQVCLRLDESGVPQSSHSEADGFGRFASQSGGSATCVTSRNGRYVVGEIDTPPESPAVSSPSVDGERAVAS
jgi:hypothetical protein